MISAPKMEASQQWQLSQPLARTQQTTALGVEVAMPQQWQTCQPTTYAAQPMNPGEFWTHVPAATIQNPQPVVMVPVPAQSSFPANSCAASCVGWPSQEFTNNCDRHAAMSADYATESCQYWQTNVPTDPVPQLIVLVPACSSSPYSPPIWQQVNFGEFAPVVAQQSAVPQQESVSSVPFATKCIELDLTSVHEPPSSGLCACPMTPESEPENAHFEHLFDSTMLEAKFAQLAEHVEYAKESLPDQGTSVICLEKSLLEQESSVDELSECGSPRDGCFNIEAIQRDSKSYASSETSTVVSRSARRRRGRRAAKAKAAKCSMLIAETPSPDDLLVTEEKKVELMQQLEAGGEAMHRAVASLRGSVLRMSLEPFGCRVVQTALDVASMVEMDSIVAELYGHVRLAISSPHANFVIQKVIEVLPINSTGFVAEELATFAAEVARHRFGCRVLSRLVEHHLCCNGAAPSTAILIDELLLETDQLIHHNFARHVLELILEHGSEAQKQKIAGAIRSNLFHYAKNRFASYVVEKALALCKPSDAQKMATDLLSDPERFLALATNECGIHVVKAVMKLPGDCAQKAKELLAAEVTRVRSSKYGKRLMDEM